MKYMFYSRKNGWPNGTIINYYHPRGICQLEKGEDGYYTNTINGKYIQGRTKGPGGANKKVGFYFKSIDFVKNIILDNY